MKTYGTVEFWELEVCRPPTEHLRFSDWDSATHAFRNIVKDTPLYARVYAVQRKSGRRIVTWSYDKPGLES